MKQYKSVEFLLNLNVKPLLLHKRKAPLLTNFWRRFCGVGVLDDNYSPL